MRPQETAWTPESDLESSPRGCVTLDKLLPIFGLLFPCLYLQGVGTADLRFCDSESWLAASGVTSGKTEVTLTFQWG